MTEKGTLDADQQLRDWAEQQGIWGSEQPTSTGIDPLRIGMGRTLAYGLAGGGLLVLVLIALEKGFDGWNERERTRERSAKVQASTEVVNEWLESQRMGRDGRGFWSAESWVQPVRLYAVRSWEIVDTDYLGSQFTVRIASSNKAGIPIEKLWTISLKGYETSHPTIFSVEETIAD